MMEPRAAHKEGTRALIATLLLVVAARAFLPQASAPPLRNANLFKVQQHRCQYPRRQHPTRRAGALVQQGASGAGGLSATLPIDAVTRAEALSGFFAALVLSTAVTVPAPSKLGVVDDLLADCPSVRGAFGQVRLSTAVACWSIAEGCNDKRRGLHQCWHYN